MKLKRYLVYQQIVTEEQVIDGVTYDKTIRVLMRKVNASTKQFAVEKFEKNTEFVKSIRRSKIACVDLETVETLI